MYASDYDETLFFQKSWDEEAQMGAGFWGASYKSYVRWPFAHQPYIKNTAVYKCPATRAVRTTGTSVQRPAAAVAPPGTSVNGLI